MISISFKSKDIQCNKRKHDLEYCYQIKRKQTTCNVLFHLYDETLLKFVLQANLIPDQNIKLKQREGSELH